MRLRSQAPGMPRSSCGGQTSSMMPKRISTSPSITRQVRRRSRRRARSRPTDSPISHEVLAMTSVRLRFVAALTLALSTVFGFGAGIASAHAQYASSTPAANATVQSAPTTLQVTYTEELSDIKISVTGPDGSEVTTAPATFNLENRHQANVSMKDAGPGTYTVLWHNVSGDDGDVMPEHRV